MKLSKNEKTIIGIVIIITVAIWTLIDNNILNIGYWWIISPICASAFYLIAMAIYEFIVSILQVGSDWGR